jgi:hypothetical protein
MSRLADAAIPSNLHYQQTLQRLIDYFLSLGGSASLAQRQATQWIGRQLEMQSSLLPISTSSTP